MSPPRPASSNTRRSAARSIARPRERCAKPPAIASGSARATGQPGCPTARSRFFATLRAGVRRRRLPHLLFISPGTVHTHVVHVYEKIGVSTRAAAALFAMEHDLLAPLSEKYTVQWIPRSRHAAYHRESRRRAIMDRVAQKRSGTAGVAGAELYYEVRGRGPAVLLIAGATGDAGHFEQAADVLASEHTVITYDRRGNSRSRPAGPTTLDQQADDAAALLRHVGADSSRSCSGRAVAPSSR